MVMKIRKLVDSIYEKQELLRKSEFKALQAQINPHFLYNSLDSIIWLLRMERTDEAIVILQNLIVLFRIFLSKGHEVIPVRQEYVIWTAIFRSNPCVTAESLHIQWMYLKNTRIFTL